jgi:hypothetical protein
MVLRLSALRASRPLPLGRFLVLILLEAESIRATGLGQLKKSIYLEGLGKITKILSQDNRSSGWHSSPNLPNTTQDRAIQSTASVIKFIWQPLLLEYRGMIANDYGFTFAGRAFSVFRKKCRMSQLFETQIRDRSQQMNTTESRAKHHVIVPAPLWHRANRGELPALLLFPTVTMDYHYNSSNLGDLYNA